MEREALKLALEALEKIFRTQYHIETPPIESLEEKMRRIAYKAIADIKETLAQSAQESGLQKKLEEALGSLDFYRRRVEALQQWQSKMRDPERTIVCDILANGHTLEPAGDRYTAPPQPAQEPVGKVVEAVEGAFRCEFTAPLPAGTKLYTAPPKRELVGLTDEEKAELVHELFAPCSKEENNALYLLTTYYANNAFYLLTAHYNKLKKKNT